MSFLVYRLNLKGLPCTLFANSQIHFYQGLFKLLPMFLILQLQDFHIFHQLKF